MKLEKIKIVLLVVCIIFIILVFMFSVLNSNQTPKEFKQVCFKHGSVCFNVDVAQTPIDRQTGLMFKEKLENSSGMLFIFEESGEYGFWMKNTLIPLDIIWINENKTIVYINENTLPCLDSNNCEVYSPDKEALYVLEINSGKVNELNLSVDSRVEFKI